ncbi:right-handed parallel beta-helix repeat-containing protein [Halorussus limi]|uniref:Right-handed parallel beta-helix repeat-containing protein n=1 Tax=Halorussus limi TaxID=2938695 RepID=A0A8U0HXB0_9EURY|nr:right-handed parallel beta-helix repeat-containing protein [Halorussus limi]UPV75557.1 right-handed parallel beta-helix repeat-containing protein [Halorussus limi]
MGEIPRRTFCALLAASAGTASGCTTMSQDRPAETNRQNDAGDVTVVTTRKGLESAFETLSPGDTIRITDENAPYRTTQWLDIDADGVTVIGPGVRALIQPAESADVGGFRIGHDGQCSEIDIRGVGYHGTPSGRPKRTERLHAIAVRDATNVTVERSHIRRTYPVKHGNGGSGISVTHNCSGVRIVNNQIHEYGDRGIQLAGKRHVVFGNVVTNGLDRPIACDLWSSKGKNPTAQSVSIFGNLLGNSVQGSLVGIARNTSSSVSDGYVGIYGNVGFGTHKSFCHVRGSKPLRNVNVQNNVSLQKTDDLKTKQTTNFSGVAVDVSEIRNLAVKNNEFYDYSGHGVRVDSDVSDTSIQNNTLASPGLAGIRFVGGADSLIDGNLITDATKAGIRLEEATDTVVRGNFVRGAGTEGIAVGGSQSPTGNEIADNYVENSGRRSSKSSPGIAVRDGGVRVRGNAVRRNDAAAIAEPAGVEGNVYEGNWADGDDPWRFASPASRVRNNDPPTGVHRGLSADSGTEVSVEFDRAYSRPPKLAFGRANGGVEGVSYATNDDGNFVGATVTLGENDGTLDVFVTQP